MTWIGQKQEPEPARPPQPTAAPVAQHVAPYPETGRVEKPEMAHAANIGKSVQIKGELSGNEDLTIEGRVDGKILLDGHIVTIGQSGRVMAEVQATSVIVGGELKGNINAEQKVEVAATGTVLGNIRAPRVSLADGARFKGSIDMDVSPASGAKPAKPPA